MRTVVLLCAIATASVAAAQRPYRITLTVQDMSAHSVPYANVVRGGANWLIADGEGHLSFSWSADRLNLEVRRLGYTPVSVTADIHADTSITVTMSPVPVHLAAQRVVAASSARLMRAGLYERLQDVRNGTRTGYFVTAEEIEMRGPARISQVLDKAPGVFVSKGILMSATNQCQMAVYLDGARFDINGNQQLNADSPGSMWGKIQAAKSHPFGDSDNGRVTGIDQFISPDDVAAIEIYPRAVAAPPMYQTLNGTCGIVAIWTK